jgi:hypothetical protein
MTIDGRFLGRIGFSSSVPSMPRDLERLTRKMPSTGGRFEN